MKSNPMKTGIVPAGDGTSYWVAGDLDTIKRSGHQTGKSFAMIEACVSPGAGPPPHRHTLEDEAFYTLEGELRLENGGETFQAGPGTWITLAKGSLHLDWRFNLHIDPVWEDPPRYHHPCRSTKLVRTA
jgi:quercetin dioxygenase-like cupin family protein